MATSFKHLLVVAGTLVLLTTCLLWLNLGRLMYQHDALQPHTLSEEDLLLQEQQHRKRLALNCPPTFALNDSKLFEDVKHVSNYTSRSYEVYRDKILILTPVSDSAKRLGHYFSLLCSLSYPHQLISVALGEDSSTDKTYEIASTLARRMSPYFRSIEVFHFQNAKKPAMLFDRHDSAIQLARRSHLAHVRNQLLMRGLTDHDWVLWIDSDVRYVPPDIIQHLLSAKADVTVPSCMYRMESGRFQVYDKNTWRETKKSIEYQSIKPKDYLMLEGYSLTMRKYLPLLAHEGIIVPLDGVGGCVLLVKADAHRKGLIFPPFVFEHHIETEGLAKMAAKMGFTIRGLPMVNVFHV